MKTILSMILFFLFSIFSTNMANGETIYFKENPFVLITTIGQKIYIKKAEIQADNKLRFLTVDGQQGSIDCHYIQNIKDLAEVLGRQRVAEKKKENLPSADQTFNSQRLPVQAENNTYDSRKKTQHVSGYTRKDGTYVQPYYRKPRR
jgi:hypothetical protein